MLQEFLKWEMGSQLLVLCFIAYIYIIHIFKSIKHLNINIFKIYLVYF